VPGASITLTAGNNAFTTKSGANGSYSFHEVPAGNYSLTVDADGFAPLTRSNVAVAAGQTRQVDLSIKIAVQQQGDAVQHFDWKRFDGK
jgi:hypothetical protein